MTHSHRPLILATVLICAATLLAGDADRWGFQTIKAKSAATRYEQAIRKAEAAHQRAITDARRQFITDLDRAKVEATQAGNLEEAIRLRDAIQTVGNDARSSTSPTSINDLSAMVGTWRLIHTEPKWKHGYEIDSQGNAERLRPDGKHTGQIGKLRRASNGDWIMNIHDRLERFTLANDGKVLFVEHFYPPTNYPDQAASQVGRGQRIDN